MYKRLLDLKSMLRKKSLLLLGPRQTGKSTLAKSLGPEVQYFDLSETNTYRELSARPEFLRQRLPERTRIVVIDEAQKIPELFDEAQVLLDRNKSLRILLTGSSARKLRRSGVNLLPGRIWRRNLFPLVTAELGEARIDDRVRRGSLPGIIDSPYYREELKNYVGLYLEEEIRAEGLTRNVGNFSRFLNVAALSNAEQINYTNVANDTGLPLNTVKGYFQILYDTLIGYELPAYRKTRTRKAAATPKFYFFDPGVANELLGRFEIERHGDLFGKALEHLIFAELRAALEYHGSGKTLSYWRSLSQFEVDFLLGDDVAVEVKAKRIVSARDERSLSALAEDLRLKRRIIVCLEQRRRRSDAGNEIIPVEEFLAELWGRGNGGLL
ncbi:MAG: ATP-binding protein [Elusimicrobia bacterium]|nr:ATP-binding protein [Elusimicrobiota bacterium]